MIKRNKGLLIITSIVTLLPLLAGLVLWNRLPDEIATHWNIAGEADSWSSKPFAVLALPLILLALHWVCTFATSLDRKNKDMDRAVVRLVLWICPVISLIMGIFLYSQALGLADSTSLLEPKFLMPFLLGLMLLIIGNLLPKCRQNRTVGIKIRWTLQDEENWNATHRFAGWTWVIGGIILMATAFLGNALISLAIMLVFCMSPALYSYLYYKKHKTGTD